MYPPVDYRPQRVVSPSLATPGRIAPAPTLLPARPRNNSRRSQSSAAFTARTFTVVRGPG